MKRGQFTLILIVGLLAGALILAAVLLYQPDTEEVTQDSAAREVKSYIRDCLTNTAREGLEKLGRRGGYMNEPVPVDARPVHERSYVMTPPGSDTRVRYWRHIAGDCPSCQEEINMPSLTGDNSIETRLESYIASNVTSCVNPNATVTPFDVTGTADSSVVFSEEDVIINLSLPVEVRNDQTTRLSAYQTRLDVPFRDLYETAEGVMVQIMTDDHFATKVTRQVLSVLGMGERSEIPPMQGEISFSRVQPWMMRDVRSSIEQYLSEEVSKVMLQGSRNPIPLPEEPEDRQNMNLLLSSTGPSFDGNDVERFRFSASYTPWHDIGLDIEGNGASSRIVVPRSLDMPNLFGLVPDITKLNYIYDISYPVIMRLNYPEALAGEGYQFQFAYESHLENNHPYNGSVSTADASLTDTGTYLCDPPQWNTGNYTFTVTNASNGAPLEGVNVEMICATESCPIGQTNSSGELKTRLPVCGIGNLTFTKPGFDQVTLGDSFSVDSQGTESVELQAQEEIRIRPWIKPLLKVPDPLRNVKQEAPEWQVGSDTLEVQQSQQAIVVFEHDTKENYVRVANYNGTGPYPKVNLLPGQYNIEGYVVDNLNKSGNKFTIEEVTIEGEDFIGIDVTEDQQLDPIDFNRSLMVGSVQFDAPVDTSMSDLQKTYMNVRMAGININSNPLEYHVDLNVLTKFNNKTKENPAIFSPTFSDS